MNSAMAGMADQLLQRAWDALTNSSSLGPLRAVIHPYPLSGSVVVQFQVF